MANPKSLDSTSPDPIKCAIYARCASDIARLSSIAEQIQRCSDYAQKNGWKVIYEFVKSDVAVSGLCLNGRKALQSLTQEIEKRPRSFDRLLIDDCSRLARNLGDFLNLLKHFQNNGVQVIAVSQGLDFGRDSARQVFMLSALTDEQYLADLGKKIRSQDASGCDFSNPPRKNPGPSV